MSYRRHLTIYGGALGENPDIALLAKYDHLIVSPSTYYQLPAILRPRALVYFSFFSWPRFNKDVKDWQPGPGDMGMPQILKTKGGTSFIYTITPAWRDAFVGAMFRFANMHRGQFAGFFLEDWQRSHSWWDVPNWIQITNMTALPEIMRSIEDMAGWMSDHLGSTGERTVVALSGHPEDFQLPRTMDWYVESFGASWQMGEMQIKAKMAEPVKPGDPVPPKGIFIQVNSSNWAIRQRAASLAEELGGSLGMQPDEGVLSYDDIEDPADWPTWP